MANFAEIQECQEDLFNELYNEVNSSVTLLSLDLMNRLEQCDLSVRSELASTIKDGCSPFFIACKNGHVEIVEYLLNVCQANTETKGNLTVDGTVHHVTPLWCAAVAGDMTVVEVLIRNGADINAISDSGSTPVRSASLKTRLEMVQLLIGQVSH